MKSLTLILLILSLHAIAQKSEVFHIDSLPTEGVLLNKNWKWHEGDNPDFAKVDFDDSAWDNIDPTQDIFDLPQISKNGQIGWLRLTLLMDESLLKKQISLVIQQTGASEIYLNGSKIVTNGIINTSEIKAQDPLWKPFPINLNNQKQQVLAVRFALQPNLLYTAIFENYNPAIWINVMDSAVGVEFHYSVTSRNLIFIFLIIGISFMIFVIHFSFYLLYPNQKANLYFSLFSLFFLLGSLSQYFYWLQPFQVSYKFYLGNLAFLLFIIAYINLLTAAYLFLEKKKDFFYYFLAVFAIIAVVLDAYPYSTGWKFGGPMLELFVQINIARIAVIAVRKKQKGSWIIAIGAFSTLIFFVIFLSQGTFTNASFLLSLPLKRMIFYNFFVLSLPISTSLFLAFQFSKINEDIKLQLIENQNLADEKQQILSTQNETLETQVTERTAELKHKNRDLEIEAALERVRSRSMAMYRSNELSDVIKVIFEQFQLLGFNIKQAGFTTNIHERDWDLWLALPNYVFPNKVILPYFNHPIFNRGREILDKKQDFLADILTFEETNEWFYHMFKTPYFNDIPEKSKSYLLSIKGMARSAVNTKNIALTIFNYDALPYSPEENLILRRFANAFEQSYTRFLDLEKAEEQAREAQIEAALERVRSRTMAMQNSEELREAANLLSKEVRELGIPIWSCGYNIMEKDEKACLGWMSTEGSIQPSFRIPLKVSPTFIKFYESRQNRVELFEEQIGGADLETHYKYMLTLDGFADILKGFINSGHQLPNAQVNTVVNFTQGNLIFISAEPIPEAHDIFKRFAYVFEQTFTRFLDLQKVEAQAREAQIEVALEKIRTRTLVMQQSNELIDIITLVNEKLKELDVVSGTIAFWFFDKENRSSTFWLATSIQEHEALVELPYNEKLMMEDTVLKDAWEARQTGVSFINKSYNNAQIQKYFDYVFANNSLAGIPPPAREFMMQAEKWIACLFVENNSTLFADSWNGQPFSDDKISILKRTAKVFEQAYVRFLDLQKAEAQAREAQIEVALERVRGRAMAMQTSKELSFLIGNIYTELTKLDLTLDRCFFMIFDPKTQGVTWWMASDESLDLGKGYFVQYSEHPPQMAYLKGWQERQERWHYLYQGEEMALWNAYLYHETDLKTLPPFIIENMRAVKTVHFSASFFNFGCLTTGTFQPLSNESFDILIRFSKVFDLTYTRFNDLQKVEAQTRETKIELVLEMIRSRSLGMHRSDELKEVMAVMFAKLTELDVLLGTVAIQLFDTKTKNCDFWLGSNILEEPTKVSLPYDEKVMNEDGYMKDCWEAKAKGESIFNKMYSFEQKNKYFDYVFTHNDESIVPTPVKQFILQAPNQIGCLIIEKNSSLFADSWNGVLYSAEQIDVLKRTAKVFEQAYIRFIDLKKAEAQAKAAKIEVALERIRSRAMNMRSSEELNDLVGFVFAECANLDMSLDRSIFMIYDDNKKDSRWWLAGIEAPDKPVNCLVKYHEYAPSLAYLQAWQNREQKWVYLLEGDNKRTWDKYVFEETEMAQLPEFVKHGMSSVESIILNASFQNYGGLTLGTYEPLSDEHFDLLVRLSKAFDLAYTRFLDLQLKEAQAVRLAEEKQKLEVTLSELKQTQNQLIQKEKLASLGELTAGIAHEIQNPLNFVNNFSELSVDLVKDLKEEIEKPAQDKEYIGELFDDLSQNQEKINHHGKRASSIVKGMLEHSRASTGVKELTDINALADEYLRLSYHGLRAKDKDFNAAMETHFQDPLSKIEIIPQDIGRVLLNLINNAFYAVNQRKQQLCEGLEPSQSLSTYTPSVSVTTQQIDNQIIIKVKDNGTGMPESVRAKVFQPFFTTKPTGQGTGLGLSLAYDIVTKGHGGSLKVLSTEGVGTEFVIQLNSS